MGKPEFWVHHPQSLLKCCRTTLVEAEVPEGVEDVEAYQKQRMAADPSEKRLKPITED